MPPLVWHSHYGVRRQANAITRGGVGAVRRDSTDVMDTFIVPPRAQARGDLSTDGVSDTVHECGADGLSSFIGRGVPRSNTGNRRRCDAGQQSTGKRKVCPRQHATVRRRHRSHTAACRQKVARRRVWMVRSSKAPRGNNRSATVFRRADVLTNGNTARAC